jgi:integrase
MANIQPTKFTRDANGVKRATRDTKWLVRYRTPEGDSRMKTFARKAEAERFGASVEVDKTKGAYVDPSGGLVTFDEYAEAWRAAQVHRASTVEMYETHLRRHVYPTFGHRPLVGIRPTEVQAWVRGRAEVLAPSTVEVVYGIFAGIMRAAVRDQMIARTPCVDIRLPAKEPARLVPYTVDQVAALTEAMPDRYRALITFGAGSGLRQGEAFGVTVDRLDFLRGREVRVDRQLVVVRNGPATFGPPKTKASYRTVPLGRVVLDALAAHLHEFGSGPDGLVFTNDDGEPLRRPRFSEVWRPAALAAGIPTGPGEPAMHGLRHFYASLLIHKGCSPKVVQARLGHATITETMDTYGHLWPADDDLTRGAVDDVLGALPVSSGVIPGLRSGHH